jgi:hypothetical protein
VHSRYQPHRRHKWPLQSQREQYNREVVPVDENLTTFQNSLGPDTPPRENTCIYREIRRPYEDDRLADAPRIRTVALPEQEEGDSRSESDLRDGSQATALMTLRPLGGDLRAILRIDDLIKFPGLFGEEAEV